MLTLALDTSTPTGSVAVTNDGALLALVVGDGTRTHGERLPGELDLALQEAGVQARDLQLLAVAAGPGAFTGLRIGIAAVQALALVHGCPVVGVSALDALALSAARSGQLEHARTLAVWQDAHRGEVFAAYYPLEHAAVVPVLSPTASPTVSLPHDAFQELATQVVAPVAFIGSGADRYADLLHGQTMLAPRLLPAPSTLAQWIAALAVERMTRGEPGRPHGLQPLYVRRPDAELARDRA